MSETAYPLRLAHAEADLRSLIRRQAQFPNSAKVRQKLIDQRRVVLAMRKGVAA